MSNYYRHGDVLLTKVNVPEGQEIKHKGSHPLAFGEITGHKHMLTVKDANNMKIMQAGKNLYIILMEIGTLTHEEHKTIEIQPGTYKMDFEREYDYASEDMRQVVD